MTDPDDDGSRSHTGRTEAFSDGVLAIVITLLVLDLRVPRARPGHLLAGLLAQWPSYAAYVASYLYVAVVWLNHRATFQRVGTADRGLQWANFFVLFATALLPFPTIVLSDALQKHDHADQRAAVALYALVGALLSAAWMVLYHYLRRHAELLAEGIDERFFSSERIRAAIGIVAFIAGGVLGYLVEPLAGMGIFVLLPTFYGITSSGLYPRNRAVRRITGS
jgi:uncharacterized membrane protein